MKTLTITVNNGTMTMQKAMKEAREVHEQTGTPVEVCNMLGDPIAYFVKGKCIKY